MSEPSSTEPVSYQVRDAVAYAVMHRPSLSVAVKTGLLEALNRAAADDDVRAVVVTGSGRGFCFGQDLGEHADALAAGGAEAAFATLELHYEPIAHALAELPKPVVAAVNGTCVGAGLSIALACDVRIARAGASFSTAFTGIGLSFDTGLSATLPRAVGAARASELIMLADAFSAEQALEWGVVGRVVAAEEWDEAVAQLAGRLAAGPTLAYVTARRALARAAAGASLAEVLAGERDDQFAVGATADHRNAVTAFLNKQKPTFTGA